MGVEDWNGREGWNDLAQVRDKQRVLVKTVMTLRVPDNMVNFLTG